MSPTSTSTRSRRSPSRGWWPPTRCWRIFGRGGVVLVSMFVMISSFSSLNGSMLASPRVFFAMADDGMFFETIAKVHPKYKTPYVAILLAALLGMILVMSRSFEALTDTFVLAIWPFYALGVAAIYRLRKSRPDMPRPYQGDRLPGRPRHLHRVGRRLRRECAHPRPGFDRPHLRAHSGGPAGLSIRVQRDALNAVPIFSVFFLDPPARYCYSFFRADTSRGVLKMDACEPRVRRRGFFLHSSDGEAGHRRTREPRRVHRSRPLPGQPGRPQDRSARAASVRRRPIAPHRRRRRATAMPAIRSGSVTGSRQRAHLPR